MKARNGGSAARAFPRASSPGMTAVASESRARSPCGRPRDGGHVTPSPPPTHRALLPMDGGRHPAGGARGCCRGCSREKWCGAFAAGKGREAAGARLRPVNLCDSILESACEHVYLRCVPAGLEAERGGGKQYESPVRPILSLKV